MTYDLTTITVYDKDDNQIKQFSGRNSVVDFYDFIDAQKSVEGIRAVASSYPIQGFVNDYMAKKNG